MVSFKKNGIVFHHSHFISQMDSFQIQRSFLFFSASFSFIFQNKTSFNFSNQKNHSIFFIKCFFFLCQSFFLQKKGKKHHSIKNTNPFLCFKKSKNIPKNEQNQTRTNQFNAPQQSQKSSDTKNNICCSQNAFQKADKCNSITKSSHQQNIIHPNDTKPPK